MKRISTGLFFGLWLCVMTSVDVWGQATAQISGTVSDQSGAVLPGVEVTATQTDTGIARKTITNETGSYVLPNLAIGPYRLEAVLPGFRTFAQTGIVLQVNSNPVINPVLEVGQVSESVEVQANAAQVETRSTAVGQVIENERILELPLEGRRVTDLIVLAGAAVQTGAGAMQGGVRISVAGGLDFGVWYSLDGNLHQNPYDGSNQPMPFPDALQEFKVEARGSSANSGPRSGGAVNAVTKAGTNEFHGNLFEFVRNYKFNARKFFATNRDTLKRNQFGGTLGGPIVANRLFFFGGYQGTTTRSDPSDTIAFVHFTAFASPACNAGRQVTLRAPFVNNRVNPVLYSKAAMNIVAKLPKAQDECGKITYGLLDKINEHQAVGKVDYQWTSSHSIFGRYLLTTYGSKPPHSFAKDNILTTSSGGLDNVAQSYALGSTYLLGPTTVNAFRMTVNRTAILLYQEPFFSAADVGVKAWSSLPHAMNVRVTGGFNIGAGSGNGGRRMTTSYQVGDDISFVSGNHQVAVGLNLAQWRIIQYTNNFPPGVYAIRGETTGLGMSDFFIGRLSSLTQVDPENWAGRQMNIGAYVQDIWKVSPRLTLTGGLRYEPFMPMRMIRGIVFSFDYDRFRQGIRSTVFKNAPAGLYFEGDPGFPKGGAFTNKRPWNFGPRVGLAWDVQGDGRTSVRSSYGIAYDFSVGFAQTTGSNSPPRGFRAVIENPSGGLDDPWSDFPGGNPFPFVMDVKNPVFLPFAEYLYPARYDLHPPTVQSWTLSVQRQLGSLVTSASYIGSQTTYLWYNRPLNNPVYISNASTTTNINQRRRLFLENPTEGQYMGVVSPHEDGGTASYHGLLFSVERRAARGVNLGGNYTWSHCITDITNSGGYTRDNNLVYPDNRAFDRGNCDADRRHVLNVTAVADSPQFANPTLRMLGTGWRLSGIYRRSSGRFMTLDTGLDRALTGSRVVGDQRPNQILGSPYGDRSSLTNYLSPNAFTQPALGTIGNMGRGNISGPGTWQLDLGLSRTFRLTENQRIEFRAEAFNVTNSLIRGIPTITLNSNIFGQINSSADARIMQFALKYVF
jgi:hypothetical protein